MNVLFIVKTLIALLLAAAAVLMVIHPWGRELRMINTGKIKMIEKRNG